MRNVVYVSLVVLCACFLGTSGCGGNDSSSTADTPVPSAEQGQPSAWTIGILTGPSPFDLSEPEGITNPVMRGEYATDMELDIVAHPYLVIEGGRFYMYFTAKHDALHQGGIGLASSSDGLHWQYERLVIDEPYDLSGPYVFKWQGDYYMTPEAHTETSVRLYKAVRFPDEWEYQQDILSGDHYISPVPFEYGGGWWMYVCRPGNETLRLFFADRPTGPWTEHPQSPIVEKDLNTARPAGSPLLIDGKLYRIAQDCEPTYGNRVLAFEVTELSRTAYAETMLEDPLWDIAPGGWHSEAAHHVDAHQLPDGSWIAAVDALGK